MNLEYALPTSADVNYTVYKYREAYFLAMLKLRGTINSHQHIILILVSWVKFAYIGWAS